MMYKVWHGDVPNYISSVFKKACVRYNSTKFLLPSARIDLYKSSLAFSGASTWNSLAPLQKDSQSLSSFKRQLFDMLLK